MDCQRCTPRCERCAPPMERADFQHITPDAPTPVGGVEIAVSTATATGVRLRPDLSPSNNTADPWDAPAQADYHAVVTITIRAYGAPTAPPDTHRGAFLAMLKSNVAAQCKPSVDRFVSDLRTILGGFDVLTK